jgi:hypothetical protein
MTVSRSAVDTMHIETKFLRLKMPVALGSYFGDWRVTWLGGWTRGKLSYLVMVARIASDSEALKPVSPPGETQNV